MASIVVDDRRGTWLVQWFNGARWVRKTIVRRRPGWKPGDPMPKKTPPEVNAALAEFEQKERAAKLRKGYDPSRTVRMFLDEYYEGYGQGHKAGTKNELRKAIALFVDWCDNNKIDKLDHVDSPACHRWISDRAKTPSPRGGTIAYGTLKKERALLAAAWVYGIKRGIVMENPWVSVDIPGKPVPTERKSWSPAEYERLIAVCQPWLRDLIIVGCHTGLRIAALRSLEWKDIEPDRAGEGYGDIVVRPENDKAGKGYRVPIHPKVHEVLFRRAAHKGTSATTILTGKLGRPIQANTVTDIAIRRACRRAGLDRPKSPNHHMRRTFGRWAVHGQLTGTPISVYVVRQWMGHSSIAMTERYLDVRNVDSTRYMLGTFDPSQDRMPA